MPLAKLYIFLFLIWLFFPFPGSGQLWKQYADSANSFSERNDISKAIEYDSIAREELRKDSLGTSTYARICYNLANSYRRVIKYSTAEELYTEAKAIWASVLGKDHFNYIICCNNLAILYINMSEYKKAVPLFLGTREYWASKRGRENLDYAKSCNNLANLYTEMYELDKAEPLYLEALAIREKLLTNQHPEYASVCDNLANLYKRKNDYLKAEMLYLKSRAIKEKVFTKEHPDYESNCNNLAILYEAKGEYSRAEALYIEALQICDKVFTKDHRRYADVCDNLAVLYSNTAQFDKAELLYLEARQIRVKKLGKNHDQYAASCNNLAGLYSRLGQYEKAEFLYLEAMGIFEKVFGKLHDYAMCCNNLALQYIRQGKLREAESVCLEAKSIYESKLGKESIHYTLNCDNLAFIYMNMGHVSRAEKLYSEAKEIKEKIKGKMHLDYAQSCTSLAFFYLFTGQYEKAQSLLYEAKNIVELVLGKLGSHYSGICRTLALVNWNLKNYNKANEFFAESFSAHKTAVSEIFQFTSADEKQFYLERVSDFDKYLYSYNSILYPAPMQELSYNVSLFGRSIILFSDKQLRSTLYHSGDKGIQLKYDMWISSREQLAFWSARPIKERPAYVDSLNEQANTLEKELIRFSASFNKGQDKITWKEIQKSLKPGEASIEVVSFQYYNGRRWTDSTYYIALLLRKDIPEPELIQLFEKKQLDTLLAGIKRKAGGNRINALYTGDAFLYDLIWKPLEKSLRGISRIYFALAGDLFKISLAALRVNEKQVLSDLYELVQLNTTAMVAERDDSFLTDADKIQLYGGIYYDADTLELKKTIQQFYAVNRKKGRSLPRDLTRSGKWDYLLGSEKEIKEIEKLGKEKKLSVTVQSGINATEESFKILDGNNSPSVLHIATHGFFFSDPANDKKKDNQRKSERGDDVFRQSDNPLFRGGLIFAGANNAWQGNQVEDIDDGILTAYEVSNVYLSNTKLVVLSACETALGDVQGSEGVYGLQRAFKMAGVQNLVMSLWKVPDNETPEFMQLFYTNLFNRQTVYDAFRNAQTTMKNKYRNEPYKWAAWVLVR